MNFSSGPFLYIIIFLVAVVLLLFILWLLSENAKKSYFDAAVKHLMQPENAPVPLTTWTEISGPDGNGVMICSATAAVDGLADEVQLALKSKDKTVMEDFTQNVKFRFSPIYEPPPVDLLQQLLGIFRVQPRPSKNKSVLDKTTQAFTPDHVLVHSQDLLLEFGMPQAGASTSKVQAKRAGPSVINKPYYSVAFHIDPRIDRKHAEGRCPTPIKCNCDRQQSYYSREQNVNVRVHVDHGRVRATPGGAVDTNRDSSLIATDTVSIKGRDQNKNQFRFLGTSMYLVRGSTGGRGR